MGAPSSSPPNEIRIHVARSRHIILVERGRSAPRTIIYGNSSGGCCREVTVRIVVNGGQRAQLPARMPSTTAHWTVCNVQQHAHILRRPELPVRVVVSTARGQPEAGMRRGCHAARHLLMPSIRPQCCSTPRVARACAVAARVLIASAGHSLDRSPPVYDCPWRLVLVDQTRRYAGAAAAGCASGPDCGAFQPEISRSSALSRSLWVRCAGGTDAETPAPARCSMRPDP